MIRKQRQIKPSEALIRLEEQCSRCEMCEFEVRQKLFRWQISTEIANKIINKLKKDKYLDDSRFARAFIHDKLHFNGYGRVKIRLALMAKRIEGSIINECMNIIDNDEYIAVAKRIIENKAAKSSEIDTYEGRTKIFRYGISRGFESAIVSEILREYCRNSLE